jgi:regulator of protease activity HflC (stomatin/prohibitin superfamily)
MASRFEYNKKAGALQEAMVAQAAEPPIVQKAELSRPNVQGQGMRQAINAMAPSAPARHRRAQDQTRANLFVPESTEVDGEEVLGGETGEVLVSARATLPRPARSALDPQVHPGWSTMLFHVVEDGQQVIVTDRRGHVEIVEGPRRLLRWGKTFRTMEHYVAHPGEFLVVRFRDGRQEHMVGPAHCWFDPRSHLSIEREEAIQISAKEAVVVYCQGDSAVSRRIVHGPATFVPSPGEWLHTFRWHGPAPGATGFHKVPGALVFQKLWLMPDQMYHDVADVRTADDAVLTIRLMLFFELVDIERMLESTHDPIGDFVNAATSDVVDFVGRRTFDDFKAETEALNDLATYRQLLSRGEQGGYKIDKVVYRGYGAPAALQRLHDEATEARVRLQLQRATEKQAQELEDFRLDRGLARAGKEREQHDAATEHRLRTSEREATASRERARLDAEAEAAVAEAKNRQQLAYLTELGKIGVDLTALMTRSPADHTIEVRGGGVPHLHLDRD